MRAWDEELRVMQKTVDSWSDPSVNKIQSRRSDPWDVLVSTIISLRTKDAITFNASKRLLSIASTPVALLKLSELEIADAIYPAGFYRTKSANLRQIAAILIDKHDGKVPSEQTDLLELPGVGLKTANLVLGLGFGVAAICVDIHVHRIANRLGWIDTATPDASEKELRQVLPEKWWIPLNRILVRFGQKICLPRSPRCSHCPVNAGCPAAFKCSSQNGTKYSRGRWPHRQAAPLC